MAHLDESFARLAADALGGRIGRDQLGMLGLEVLEPPHHPVVFGVADLGLIEHVIQMLVMMQLFAQILDFFAIFFSSLCWRASTIIRVLSRATGRPFSFTILTRADSDGEAMRFDGPSSCWTRAGLLSIPLPPPGPGHAGEIARQAVDRGADLILVAGGDGTINEVVNGMVIRTFP